jgi:hypothetical protein
MATKMNLFALCALAVAVACPAAFATSFTTASVEIESVPTDVTGGGYQVVTNSAPATIATESNSLSGDWGSASGFASADLTTGQLKVQAAASNPPVGSSPYINVNAYFGDSFTTSTASNQPFAWSSSTTAQFSMTLAGTLSPSDDLASVGSSAFVVLILYNKGTLDPNSLLGSNVIGAPYLWTIGNPDIQLYYTPASGTSVPVAATGEFNSIPSNITQTITPGGDFDWVLLVGAGGQPGPDQSVDIDMAHTVTLGYQGPQGSVTTSDSGLFQNITTATPEPTSLAILALGFGATLTRRRNTPNRTH